MADVADEVPYLVETTLSEALYDAAIVTAARDTSHAGRLDSPSVSVREDNPLCGDRITLDLSIETGRITAARHHTRGCLLTRAAAAILTEQVTGAAPRDVAQLEKEVELLLAGDPAAAIPSALQMFTPVGGVPSRHACVLLPFRALARALEESRRGDT